MADIDSTAAATALRRDNVRIDDPRHRAADAAMRYDAGPIAPLSIEQTRALVASVSWTQSGGDPFAEHRFGFVGQYQLTPGQLAQAGFVNSGRYAEAMTDYRSEWKWAADGGARQFLADPANWRQNLDVHAYRGSEQLQNASFRAYCEDAYGRARERGVLAGDEKPTLVAGYLKVHAVMGEGPADSAITGGRKFEVPGRDSNYRLLHHLSRGLDGLEPYLAAASERATTLGNIPFGTTPFGMALSGVATPPLDPSAGPRLDQEGHPDNPRFVLAREMVQARFGLQGDALDNAAGVATLQARGAGLKGYGEVLQVAGCAWVLDTHRDDPAHQRFLFDPEKAVTTPLAETSRAYNREFAIAQSPDIVPARAATDVVAIEPIQRGPAV